MEIMKWTGLVCTQTEDNVFETVSNLCSLISCMVHGSSDLPTVLVSKEIDLLLHHHEQPRKEIGNGKFEMDAIYANFKNFTSVRNFFP